MVDRPPRVIDSEVDGGGGILGTRSYHAGLTSLCVVYSRYPSETMSSH